MSETNTNGRVHSEKCALALSINQATTRPQWNMRESIEGYARHGVKGLSVWPDKLRKCGIRHARQLLSDYGLGVAAYCVGGMFSDVGGATRGEIDRLRRFVEEAEAIDATCMVSVVGTVADDRDLGAARKRVVDALAELLPHAQAAGVPLAIEPIHPMRLGDLCCINTLRQALDACDVLGSGVGVVVDTFHLWWDPELCSMIERAGDRILSFQVSDWLRDTSAIKDQRGMMGDGLIDIPRIRKKVEAAGYNGFCDAEIMSADDWWRRDPDTVVQTCVERFESAC